MSKLRPVFKSAEDSPSSSVISETTLQDPMDRNRVSQDPKPGAWLTVCRTVVLSVSPVVYFAALVLLAAVSLFIFRSPEARFLLRRLLQFTWPTTEATLAKAGVISTVIENSVRWDSVFQVSYSVAGKPFFGYFAFYSMEIEPKEAEKLQPAWDGAKVTLRYDPRHPETFILIRDFASSYDVVYPPEFSGSSFYGSTDPLHLPKATDPSDS